MTTIRGWIAAYLRDFWRNVDTGLAVLTDGVLVLIRAALLTSLLLSLPALAAAALIAALR